MAVVVALLAHGEASASDSNLTSDQVAAEIARSQIKADDLARQWAEAESRRDELAVEIAAAEADLATVTAELTRFEKDLAAIAIDSFTGRSGRPILPFGDLTDLLQADVLRGVALDTGQTDLDAIDAVRNDLDEQTTRVAALQEQNRQVGEQIEARQAELDAELFALERLRVHLKDEETRRAYEAELARQRQQQAAQVAEANARAAARAVATTQPPAAKGGGVRPAVIAGAPAASPAASPQPAPAPVTAPEPAGSPPPPPAAP
ncbi:MAG: hypothetical protein AAB131_14770, partial [Actinomycetota bacterium]